MGFDLPVEGEYHQVAILKNPPGLSAPAPACIDGITTTYFRAEVGGLTLVGDFFGHRGADPDDVPAVAPRPNPSRAWSSESRTRARAGRGRHPARGHGVYDSVRTCGRSSVRIPGVSGLYSSAGFSGMGFKISPAVGLVVSELLLDGERDLRRHRELATDRFGKGSSIKAEFEYGDEEPSAYT